MPKSLRAILAKSKVVPLANESGCEREPAVASNKQKGSARKTRAAKQIMQSKNLVVAGSDLVNRGSSERFARQGTKSARILELLTGADGVTLDRVDSRDGLAATLNPRLSLWQCRQEDGPEAHFD